jgi:hypothetical protein
MTSTKTRRAALNLLPGTLRTMLWGAATLALAHCGGGASTPTGGATPPPVTLPTPTPTPTPTATLPPGMTCFPTPPPLYGIIVKVQVGTSGRKTLDSRPLVINTNGYCESVGFGGYFCYTRREDDPESQACDYMALGQASDTGRWGPTWTADGNPCTTSDGPGCQNHPANQFLAIAKGEGLFSACAAPNIPLSTDPRRPGSRCGLCRMVAGASECQ